MKRIHQEHPKKCWAQIQSLLFNGNDLLDIEHYALNAGASEERVTQDDSRNIRTQNINPWLANKSHVN